jgi:hypothetical protein
MSERDDSLYTLAKLQERPPRSARDLAVLEAAKVKAALNKQKAVIAGKKAESFWSFLGKPMWLGTGSLAAAALSVFIVVGHQVAPDEKVASAPVAAAPASAPATAPPPVSEVAIQRDVAVPKKEAATQTSKQKVTSESNNADLAKVGPAPSLEPVPAPVALASVPTSPPANVEAPVASTTSQAQLPVPASPSGRMAVAAAPAPAFAGAPSGIARKRESTASLAAPDTCLLDIKAIPLERQTLAAESTKQLLTQCAQSVPKTQWPTDIDWAKKLLDQQQEKSLLNAAEKPQ